MQTLRTQLQALRSILDHIGAHTSKMPLGRATGESSARQLLNGRRLHMAEEIGSDSEDCGGTTLQEDVCSFCCHAVAQVAGQLRTRFMRLLGRAAASDGNSEHEENHWIQS